MLALITWHAAIAQDHVIKCAEGMCVIPEEALARLVSMASAAEQYAAMCGWTK